MRFQQDTRLSLSLSRALIGTDQRIKVLTFVETKSHIVFFSKVFLAAISRLPSDGIESQYYAPFKLLEATD